MLESATVPERMAKVAKQKADNKGFILTGVLMLRAAAEPARAARATRLETCIVIIRLFRVVWQKTEGLQKYGAEELFGRRRKKGVEIVGRGIINSWSWRRFTASTHSTQFLRDRVTNCPKGKP